MLCFGVFKNPLWGFLLWWRLLPSDSLPCRQQFSFRMLRTCDLFLHNRSTGHWPCASDVLLALTAVPDPGPFASWRLGTWHSGPWPALPPGWMPDTHVHLTVLVSRPARQHTLLSGSGHRTPSQRSNHSRCESRNTNPNTNTVKCGVRSLKVL